MGFDPHIAAIRFGCGLSPEVPPPVSASAMLAALKGPDRAAELAPIGAFDDHLALLARNSRKLKKLRAARRDGDQTADARIRKIRTQAAAISEANFAATLIRGLTTEDGFRERLTAFWSDHFSTRGRDGQIKAGVGAYVDDALRPRLAGRFDDLLIAAVTHPMMVDYLDQARSMGPNSPAARARQASGRSPGLNENLAREILELHTLGVQGPYTQDDVRGLAMLLTGLTFTLDQGQHFRPQFSEPGPITVLGKDYRQGPPAMRDITQALRDIARHPATARHIAYKLAVHFVSDRPDESLVAAMEAAFLASDGDLMAVYAAMLAHPAAWLAEKRNVKPPLVYMISALRGLGVSPNAVTAQTSRELRLELLRPLQAMGHRWEFPAGPDGLPEADASWISPPNLAARVQWALAVPERLGSLPDPRDFVQLALGDDIPEPVRFAAASAESRREGIALVLMSPAFQRM